MSLDGNLLQLLSDNLPLGEPIYTLGSQRPNWIARIAPDGIYVETVRSRDRGVDPERVPAEMLTKAWERLTVRHGLTYKELVASDDLNVKRSSFVCAALAQLPGVVVTSTRPIGSFTNADSAHFARARASVNFAVSQSGMRSSRRGKSSRSSPYRDWLISGSSSSSIGSPESGRAQW